ncbi:MAG TPA: alpha/beta fold hydrolase [Longimicrobiales bacterium]|nr:alpha/beta fold hydrolase [Longimicrobiales bacterium]
MAATDLHVEAQGSGPVVVLAHGFAGSARNWRPQVRALRDRYRVVTTDARGHARSPAPDVAAAYRQDALVGDLAAVVEEASGAAPAVVGGLSMGAAVALLLALARPERVRALVLASLPAGSRSGQDIAARAERFAEAIEREGIEAAGARFAWGPESGLDPAGAALVRQGFLEHPPHGLVHTLRELLASWPSVEALAPRLASVQIPTLVVAGTADRASLGPCRELAKALPAAELEEIPGAGHVVNLAAPAAFNAALRRFLEGLPA